MLRPSPPALETPEEDAGTAEPARWRLDAGLNPGLAPLSPELAPTHKWSRLWCGPVECWQNNSKCKPDRCNKTALSLMSVLRMGQTRSGPGGITIVVDKEPEACLLALAQPPTGHQTSGAPPDCPRSDVAPENEQFGRVHLQAFHFQRCVILGSIEPPPICQSFYPPFLLSPFSPPKGI